MKYIPNFLTILRILAIPILILIILSPIKQLNFFAFILFFLISLTDYFDGFIARKMNLESDFGKMLDPIADKLLITCCIIALIIKGIIIGATLIPAFIIISREIFISGLREFNASKKTNNKINVSFLGKVKTSIQMISLISLILSLSFEGFQFYLLKFGLISLWIAMILSLISGYQYFKKA